MQTSGKEKHGQKLINIEEDINDLELELLYQIEGILAVAYNLPFKTKSNVARDHADIIAMLACLGMLTTQVDGRRWGNSWQITEEGLQLFNDLRSYLDGLDGEDE